jgi:kynurenine formamidase
MEKKKINREKQKELQQYFFNMYVIHCSKHCKRDIITVEELKNKINNAIIDTSAMSFNFNC